MNKSRSDLVHIVLSVSDSTAALSRLSGVSVPFFRRDLFLLNQNIIMPFLPSLHLLLCLISFLIYSLLLHRNESTYKPSLWSLLSAVYVSKARHSVLDDQSESSSMNNAN